MIPNISRPNVSFTANEYNVREAFKNKLNQNDKTALEQTNWCQSPIRTNLNNPVPMHGQGQKLDVIA